MTWLFRRLLSLLFLPGLIGPAILSPAAQTALAQPGATVFINEIHYDEGSTGLDEGIEITGPAGTMLTGWALVLYDGTTGLAYSRITITGRILDAGNGWGFITFPFPAGFLHNGAPDGLALADSAGGVVMFLSYEGIFTALDGPASGLTSTDIGVAETGSEPAGYSLQLVGTGTQYSDFAWAPPQPATFGAPNETQVFPPPQENQPITMTCGSALVSYQGLSTTTTVSAVDPDGLVTRLEFALPQPEGMLLVSSMTPSPAVGQPASADLTASDFAVPGRYPILVTATNNDPQPQSATCTLEVAVLEVLPVGVVQGVVSDTDDGLTHRSPYAPPTGEEPGQDVAVRGVIYALATTEPVSGLPGNGFYLQNTQPTADGDPNSSDGLFVFHDSYPSIRIKGGGFYIPQVGDEVFLRGRIVERGTVTGMANPFLVRVLRSGVELDLEIPAIVTDPPDDPAEAARYWERIESMRTLTLEKTSQ